MASTCCRKYLGRKRKNFWKKLLLLLNYRNDSIHLLGRLFALGSWQGKVLRTSYYKGGAYWGRGVGWRAGGGGERTMADIVTLTIGGLVAKQ